MEGSIFEKSIIQHSLLLRVYINNSIESKYFFFSPEKLLQNRRVEYLCGWGKRKPVLFGVEAEIFIESNFSFRIFTIPGKLILRVCLRRRRCGRKNFLFPSDEIRFFSLPVHLNGPLSLFKRQVWRMEM